jgi:cation transport regulator ChaC
MNLSTLLDKVIPNDSLFHKSSGLWDYYLSEEHFKEGKDYLNQRANESFHDFAERIVQSHIESEVDQEEKLVTIDYAIYKDKEPVSSFAKVRQEERPEYELNSGRIDKIPLIKSASIANPSNIEALHSIVRELDILGIDTSELNLQEGIPATPERKFALWISNWFMQLKVSK